MRWRFWKKKPVQPANQPATAIPPVLVSAQSRLTGIVEIKWEAITKQPPPDPTVGQCVFCNANVVVMEDYFQLREIAGRPFYGDGVVACGSCAVKQGLKW